jgi:hypothetical protein
MSRKSYLQQYTIVTNLPILLYFCSLVMEFRSYNRQNELSRVVVSIVITPLFRFCGPLRLISNKTAVHFCHNALLK